MQDLIEDNCRFGLPCSHISVPIANREEQRTALAYAVSPQVGPFNRCFQNMGHPPIEASTGWSCAKRRPNLGIKMPPGSKR